LQDYLDTVSVVIPCYNEERFIVKALESLSDQYDPEHYEIIVVDGMSDDQTRAQIAEFSRAHPEISVRIVDNPARNIPTALNLGVQNARGEIIARMDAHAVPPKGYIHRCVEVLNQHGVGVVGMPCNIRPGTSTLMAQAIASAVSHPFGIGDAKYRLSESQLARESVDTVAFSCFRKPLWRELGGFNEDLLTNEDYDFNYRVRRSGWQVILDRSGHCDYFARSTLSQLSQQYRRYGHWKAQMVKLHPASIKLRHLVAPAFVVSIVLLLLAGIFVPLAWLALVSELWLYFLLAAYFGYKVARRNGQGLRMALLMLVVFLTIHISWGTSFLLGLLRGPRRAVESQLARSSS
jgi:cellulose synthase/poly-beta-1,6-N-acetylglucosamine synthase-like glycosyltransferase